MSTAVPSNACPAESGPGERTPSTGRWGSADRSRELVACPAKSRVLPGERQILVYRRSGLASAPVDAKGFVRSKILGRKVRLLRSRKKAGLVFFKPEVHK